MLIPKYLEGISEIVNTSKNIEELKLNVNVVIVISLSMNLLMLIM